MLSSITLGYVKSRKGGAQDKDFKRMRILFDSGCGATLIKKEFTKKLKTTKAPVSKWNTKAGSFETKRKVKAQFLLPEFFADREVKWTMHVDESKVDDKTYNMIIGRDLR